MARARWYPIVFVLLSALSTTAAEVLLKIGATAAVTSPEEFLVALVNLWVAWGILAYVGGLVLWLIALPHMDLHLAYGLVAVVHLFVPLSCWLILHEAIPVGRMAGMGLVLIGSIILGFSHE
jgi:multidrug transporter EmrE-like cation transporter